MILERSVPATGAGLGDDARGYRRLLGGLVARADDLMDLVLAPIIRLPRHPVLAARFGLPALRSATGLARSHFEGLRARALVAGLSAHSMVSLERPTTASFGLVLAVTAHAYGWPLVRGGTGELARAMAAELASLGGEIVTGRRITAIEELPPSRAILFDTSPRALATIAGDRLPAGYRRRLGRFRYGPGVVKVDWALSGPIPWAAERALRTGTVHVGGTMEEIALAEAEVAAGRHPERPFVLVVQATPFDPSRAPDGRHTGWAYCHVPNGSTVDMTERMEAQVERFAPGFRDLILARSVRLPADMEAYDANYVGGDINCGLQDLRQLLTRPVARLDPYATPAPGLYLCSSSTPPGGGVHGMSGYWAARSALRRDFGMRVGGLA